jgi:hypothetical protein
MIYSHAIPFFVVVLPSTNKVHRISPMPWLTTIALRLRGWSPVFVKRMLPSGGILCFNPFPGFLFFLGKYSLLFFRIVHHGTKARKIPGPQIRGVFSSHIQWLTEKGHFWNYGCA